MLRRGHTHTPLTSRLLLQHCWVSDREVVGEERAYPPPPFQLHPSHPAHHFLPRSLTRCLLSHILSLISQITFISFLLWVRHALPLTLLSSRQFILYLSTPKPPELVEKEEKREDNQWQMATVENTHWSVISVQARTLLNGRVWQFWNCKPLISSLAVHQCLHGHICIFLCVIQTHTHTHTHTQSHTCVLCLVGERTDIKVWSNVVFPIVEILMVNTFSFQNQS